MRWWRRQGERLPPGAVNPRAAAENSLAGLAVSDLLKCSSLPVQLAMFRAKYPVRNVYEAQAAFQELVPEVRCLSSRVEHLIRLLLIWSVSFWTAKRSFSAWRRLKSTMSPQRLNVDAKLTKIYYRQPGYVAPGIPILEYFKHQKWYFWTIDH